MSFDFDQFEIGCFQKMEIFFRSFRFLFFIVDMFSSLIIGTSHALPNEI